jgi:hypothetical protein
MKVRLTTSYLGNQPRNGLLNTILYEFPADCDCIDIFVRNNADGINDYWEITGLKGEPPNQTMHEPIELEDVRPIIITEE